MGGGWLLPLRWRSRKSDTASITAARPPHELDENQKKRRVSVNLTNTETLPKPGDGSKDPTGW